MTDDERLRALLRESATPTPGAALDGRILAAYRALHPPLWRRIWTMRISVPMPVMAAAMVLLVAVLWFALRQPSPTANAPASHYAHKTESAGFQPLPDGAARVIEVKD